MRTTILATTFNGTKITPTIEWFVEKGSNAVLDEDIYKELKAKEFESKKSIQDLKEAQGYSIGKLEFAQNISKTNNSGYVFGMKLASREASFGDLGFSDFLGGVSQVLQNSPDYNTFKAYMTNPTMAQKLLNTAPKDLNYPGSRTNFKTKFVYEVPLFTGYKIKYAKEIAKLQIKAKEFKFNRDKNTLAIEEIGRAHV